MDDTLDQGATLDENRETSAIPRHREIKD